MSGIEWRPAPPDEAVRQDQERWPLLDDLLPPQSPAVGGPGLNSVQTQQALRALIDAAFGP